MPNFALRYQAVRSSARLAAKARWRTRGKEDAAKASFMKSRRSVGWVLICSFLGNAVSHKQGEIQVELTNASVEMKHFLHLGPPLPLFSRGQRFLHGLHHSPPFLRFSVCSHFGPVT